MRAKEDRSLYLLLVPGMAFYLVFKYGPLYGVLMAFEDYNFMVGVFRSRWVGLEVFRDVFRDSEFYRVLLNTLRLNLLSLVVLFPLPIVFALLLNEIRLASFKRVVQSLSYLPHFISWVILYGLLLAFVSKDTGLLNVLLKRLGLPQIGFLSERSWWLSVYVLSGAWKETGWAAIIYLAALSAIDPALYEAAAIDGANRWRATLSVTLPGIKGTIMVILILNVGRIMSIGFDQPYLLGNPLVSDVSKVVSVFIYERGLVEARYSFTTAVGLFQSLVNFVLLLGADALARLLGEPGIFVRRGA